jgi:NAD(P) transhydrogenase
VHANEADVTVLVTRRELRNTNTRYEHDHDNHLDYAADAGALSSRHESCVFAASSSWSYRYSSLLLPFSSSSNLSPPARNIRPLYLPTSRKRVPPRVNCTALVPIRHGTVLSTSSPSETLPATSAIPYEKLTIGVVRETWPNERRVAITPQNAALLLKKGFSRILVERGAGKDAQFTDAAYQKAGVTLSDERAVWGQSDIILKVRAPSFEGEISEVDRLKEGATVISFVYPRQNEKTVEKLASRGVTSFAMDMIPRISRAQVFDALR